MIIHDDKKRRAENSNAAKRPVTLSKPEKLLNRFGLNAHNGLNLRGRSPSMDSLRGGSLSILDSECRVLVRFIS